MTPSVHRHFDDQLEALSRKLLRLGGSVESAIEQAIQALVRRDSDLARRVIADDDKINAMELEIDEACLELLALHQPMARDLRFIATAMKITPDLERIADHAANICERAIELNREPQLKPLIDIPWMAERAQAMVRGALDAMMRKDGRAARQVIAMDDGLDERLEQLFRELISFMIEDPHAISRAMRLSFIAKSLERIGDQATNICEQVVFMSEARVIKHGGGPSERGSSST